MPRRLAAVVVGSLDSEDEFGRIQACTMVSLRDGRDDDDQLVEHSQLGAAGKRWAAGAVDGLPRDSLSAAAGQGRAYSQVSAAVGGSPHAGV